ncbi:MAG: hypothetical protein BMS9Abin12_2363 [Acidimicrobiia bacterium]|nr:MAG: hypothetical protein BMS9Abin12_2363 [Acidimicrobiia bacterium]
MIIGIFGLLVQLAIIVGIVLLIVRLSSGRDKATSEGVGVAIRRFFVYAIMLTMLILVGIGVAGLIEAALPGSNELTDSSTQTAISIAFVIVGLPVYVGLALYTRRRLRDDPHEQRSLGWAFYLTVALIGSLLASMSLVGAVLSGLADQGKIDRTLLIHAAVWTTIWAWHWWVSRVREAKRSTEIHMLLGSAVGLIWTFVGAFATIAAVLTTIYDGLFLVLILDSGISQILRPLSVLIVGFPVWWWYWFRHARHIPRTPWWLAHTLLLGVLGGAVAVITGTGVVLYGLLQWILNDLSSAAAHFTFLPGAVTGVLVGGAVWTYHASVLDGSRERDRSEIGRMYDYLLSGAGLVVAAGGVTTLIVTVVKATSGTTITSSSSGNVLAAAITLIVIGAPLWWRYWSTIQKARAQDPTGELQSITRRIYIVVLFGVAAVIAVISLIVILFIFFQNILDGTLGSVTLDNAAVPIALLLTAGALAWYHFAVFREDRKTSLPDDGTQGPDPHPLAWPRPASRGSLEQTLESLDAMGHGHVIVTTTAEGYEITPSSE